jgi:hypothetical protein
MPAKGFTRKEEPEHFGRYHKRVMRFEDDTPMIVARPKLQELAVAATKTFANECEHAPKDKHEEMWKEHQKYLNVSCGPYTFMGFPVRPDTKHDQTLLIDKEGNKVGRMEPGDSFMHPDALETGEEAGDEG